MPLDQVVPDATPQSGAPGRAPARAPARAAGPGPVALLTALYAAGYLLWQQSGWGSDGVRDLIADVAFMPLNLLSASLFGLASRRPTLHPDVRRGLAILAVSALLVFLGNSISVYYKVALARSPAVSWADLFYLSDSILTLVALRSFPLARRSPLEWWKFALDAAMVLVCGAVAIWYFVVRPTPTPDQPEGIAVALTFAYPLAGMLVLLGITTALLRRPTDGNRRAFGLLVSGCALGIVADLTFTLLSADLGRRAAAWTDAIYLLVYLLLVSSGELYYRRPVPARPGPASEAHDPQPLSPIPYAAALLTYGLLLLVALREWIDPISGVAIGAALITILVLARQFLAVRQNVLLLSEAAARQTEARFRSLVQHSSDVIFVVRPDASVRFVSPSVSRVFGYEPARLLDTQLSDLVHPDDGHGLRAFLTTAARMPGATPPAEWRIRRPDGSWLQAETVGTNLLDDPAVDGIVLNARDVSERKLLEQQLTHQAFHDPLTGLANRALFRDRVSHALVLAQRQEGRLAVVFLDLDDFKKVNDSLGHPEGDRLLTGVAKRLRTCARESDTVARLGGDEFAVLIEGTDADGQAAVVARILAALAEPMLVGGAEVSVRASIGLATATGGESADDLLRNADVAMYSAKRDGKGRHAVFDPSMYEDVRLRLETEDALRRAIEGGEMTVYYQPVVALRTGLLRGVEALVRWEHPRLGRLPPHHFIALAEETGLIVALEEWVLREAAGQLRRWRESYPELPITVAVNASGRHLQEPDVVARIRALVTAAGVDPRHLVLEITESVLMQQTDAVLAKLQAIREFGIRLAIDDFGTGYSSLSYLQRFPIDILKIAKPFVDEVTGGVEQSALARAIIGLGDTLRLQTLAEGIERPEQQATLLGLGCELGQGYHFAPPLPAAEIELLLRQPDAPVSEPRDVTLAG